MARRVRSGSVAVVEALASTQLGLFTLAQARSIGMPQQTVAYHSGPGGRWRRVFPSVYELADLPPDPRRVMFAAQLWAERGAVLSHRAAGLLLRFDGINREAPPEFWSAKTKTTDGVILHRGALLPTEITTTGPLRHTNILRTVRDLASVLDDDTLELVVESALRTNPRRERQLLAATNSGRRGSRTLARVLARRPPGAPPTESELETRYIQLLRTVAIPAPVRQFRVFDDGGRFLGRLDLCWPEAKLWVELDSRAWHDRPEALFRDRHRQNDLVTELQWLPIRFTWADVVHHPRHTTSQTERVCQRRMARAERGNGGPGDREPHP